MIKPGVDLSKLRPQILLAWDAWKQQCARFGHRAVITSGCETAPGRLPNSKHYSGDALDYRIAGLSTLQLQDMVAEMKSMLGRDFDVVIKSNHVHSEYDPK